MAIKKFQGKPRITFEFMSGGSIIFEPREDITPFELATLLPYLLGGADGGFYSFVPDGFIDSIPGDLKRHFSKIIDIR